MRRTSVDGAAINAQLAPETVYGIDPRGWAWFRQITGLNARAMAGATRVIDPVATFNGDTGHAAQSFSGLAPLVGGVKPDARESSQMSDERAAGALTNGALAIFAERLRRGR